MQKFLFYLINWDREKLLLEPTNWGQIEKFSWLAEIVANKLEDRFFCMWKLALFCSWTFNAAAYSSKPGENEFISLSSIALHFCIAVKRIHTWSESALWNYTERLILTTVTDKKFIGHCNCFCLWDIADYSLPGKISFTVGIFIYLFILWSTTFFIYSGS
jgi:hypothetical protein